MSDDWGRKESAETKMRKGIKGGKEREKESKTQRKKPILHIGKRALKTIVECCLVNRKSVQLKKINTTFH